MTWEPTPAERAEYAELVAWVRAQEPGTVGARLCCPRGHLLATVGVWVNVGSEHLMMQPKLAGWGTGTKFEHKSGFRLDEQSSDRFLKVRLVCQHRGCRYRGTHLFDKLTVRVARHALRGHGVDLHMTD